MLPDKASIAVDTQGLNISTGGVHAIKFGWSESDGTCCIDLLTNTVRFINGVAAVFLYMPDNMPWQIMQGLAPCIPGSCGLMTSDSLLPANPYLLRRIDLMFSCLLFHVLCSLFHFV